MPSRVLSCLPTYSISRDRRYLRHQTVNNGPGGAGGPLRTAESAAAQPDSVPASSFEREINIREVGTPLTRRDDDTVIISVPVASSVIDSQCRVQYAAAGAWYARSVFGACGRCSRRRNSGRVRAKLQSTPRCDFASFRCSFRRSARGRIDRAHQSSGTVRRPLGLHFCGQN